MSERNQSNTTTNLQPHVLEQGDIYFFYRPKKDAQEVKGIEDVRSVAACVITGSIIEKYATLSS